MYKQRSDAILQIYRECDAILAEETSVKWLAQATSPELSTYCVRVFGNDSVADVPSVQHGNVVVSYLACDIAKQYIFSKLPKE